MIQAIAISCLALSNTAQRLPSSPSRQGSTIDANTGASWHPQRELGDQDDTSDGSYTVSTSSVSLSRIDYQDFSIQDILPMGQGSSTTTVFGGVMTVATGDEQSFLGKYSNRLGQTNWVESYKQFDSNPSVEGRVSTLFPFGGSHFGGAGYTYERYETYNLLVLDSDLSSGSTRQAVYDFEQDTIGHGGVSLNTSCALVLGESGYVPSISMFCPWSSGVYLDESIAYKGSKTGHYQDAAVFNEESVIAVSELNSWDGAEYALGISNISSYDMSMNWNTMIRLFDNSQSIQAQSVLIDPLDNSINVLGKLDGANKRFNTFLGRFIPSNTSEYHLDQAYAYALCFDDCMSSGTAGGDPAPIGMGISSQNYLVVASQSDNWECIRILVLQSIDTLFGTRPAVRKHFCLELPGSTSYSAGNVYVNANDEIVVGIGDNGMTDLSSSITTLSLNGELKSCYEGTTVEEYPTSDIFLNSVILTFSENTEDWNPTTLSYSRIPLDLETESWDIVSGAAGNDDISSELTCEVSEFETDEIPLLMDWGWEEALGEYAFITYPVLIALGILFIGLLIGAPIKKCIDKRKLDGPRQYNSRHSESGSQGYSSDDEDGEHKTFICCVNCCFVYNDNRRGRR